MDPARFGKSFKQVGMNVLGDYPERIDARNPEHMDKLRTTRVFFESMLKLLPCSHCRGSALEFTKQYPIGPHLAQGRESMMHWYYTILDKVNEKLIHQERLKYNYVCDRIEKMSVTPRARQQMRKRASRILFTKPSPSFEEVKREYSACRRGERSEDPYSSWFPVTRTKPYEASVTSSQLDAIRRGGVRL